MRLSNFWVPIMESTRTAIEQSTQDAESLAQELKTALNAATARAQSNGFSAEDAQAALFAVVAWIDELAMSEQWSGAAQWRRLPLQREYFATTRAGVAFFEKLEALPDNATEVREIYALVMLNGFHGRYTHRPVTELMAYRSALLQRVAQEREIDDLASDHPLFPAANSRSAASPGMHTANSSLVSLLVILVPVCLLLGLYLLLDYRLAHTAAQLVAPLAGRP